MSTWFITGCSTGLGRHLAIAVLESGHNAVITARNPATLEELVARYPDTALAITLEVSDSTQMAGALKKAEARFGSVDVLVNNAGHGYRSAIEEGNEAEVAELFATNVFGPVALIKAALPGMRARRQGVIVNVSSMAGRAAAAGSGYYAASKFTLEGLSDALRKEVGPLGIKVLLVEPGQLRTDFAGRSLLQSPAAIADYAETAGKRRKENDKVHGTQIGDPDRAARIIIECVEMKMADSPFRLLLGSDAVRFVKGELESQQAELGKWEQLSMRSDYPE